MIKDSYKVLGVSEGATNKEIENAYQMLKAKYSQDRFLEGELGNEAAKNLTKLQTAYEEIMLARRNDEKKSNNSASSDFSEVESLIRSGKISEAQAKLDDYSQRSAEWHYLQAVIFYKKNWYNESKKQLEIALNMDPFNNKYSETLAKLKQKTDFNERRFNNQEGEYSNPEQRQMGGSGSNECMQFCITWCCVNALCNSCCR